MNSSIVGVSESYRAITFLSINRVFFTKKKQDTLKIWKHFESIWHRYVLIEHCSIEHQRNTIDIIDTIVDTLCVRLKAPKLMIKLWRKKGQISFRFGQEKSAFDSKCKTAVREWADCRKEIENYLTTPHLKKKNYLNSLYKLSIIKWKTKPHCTMTYTFYDPWFVLLANLVLLRLACNT